MSTNFENLELIRTAMSFFNDLPSRDRKKLYNEIMGRLRKMKKEEIERCIRFGNSRKLSWSLIRQGLMALNKITPGGAIHPMDRGRVFFLFERLRLWMIPWQTDEVVEFLSEYCKWNTYALKIVKEISGKVLNGVQIRTRHRIGWQPDTNQWFVAAEREVLNAIKS